MPSLTGIARTPADLVDGRADQYRPLAGYAAPRATRAMAATFTVYAVADALQMTHAVGKAAARRQTAE